MKSLRIVAHALQTKKRGGLLLIIGLAVGLIACQAPTFAPAPTPTSEPRSTPTAGADPQRMPTKQGQSLSTPALIEQALAEGTITFEQRLLYLAYAIYEYQSLPAQFQSTVGWRGTSTVEELRQASRQSSIMCSLSPAVQNESDVC